MTRLTKAMSKDRIAYMYVDDDDEEIVIKPKDMFTDENAMYDKMAIDGDEELKSKPRSERIKIAKEWVKDGTFRIIRIKG